MSLVYGSRINGRDNLADYSQKMRERLNRTHLFPTNMRNGMLTDIDLDNKSPTYKSNSVGHVLPLGR